MLYMNESNFRRPQNSPGRNFRIESDEYDVLFGEREQQRQRQRQTTNTQPPRNPYMTAQKSKQPQQQKETVFQIITVDVLTKNHGLPSSIHALFVQNASIISVPGMNSKENFAFFPHPFLFCHIFPAAFASRQSICGPGGVVL